MLLKKTEPIFDFSFIITTRNNFNELKRTISSIVSEAPDNSEIVIVDGSESAIGKESIFKFIPNIKIGITYTTDNKMGVFNAMNLGVENSLGEWIIMVTAGDYLKAESKILFKSIKNSASDVIVFAQDVEDLSGEIKYSFYPTIKSVWPHQSVILRRKVHEEIGLYPTHFKFSSDQQLFADIRQHMKVEIKNEIFSVFCLGGITSSSSLQKSKEIFVFRKKLGDGNITSFFRAFISTNIRYLLERIPLFRPFSIFLRKRMFTDYKNNK